MISAKQAFLASMGSCKTTLPIVRDTVMDRVDKAIASGKFSVSICLSSEDQHAIGIYKVAAKELQDIGYKAKVTVRKLYTYLDIDWSSEELFKEWV